MDLTGLVSKILFSVENIDLGRKNLATDGREHEGRLFYEDGISIASDTFQAVQVTADPKTIVVIEHTFLKQELQFCNEADADTRNSLTQAIQGRR
jgi:hypothetical protein